MRIADDGDVSVPLLQEALADLAANAAEIKADKVAAPLQFAEGIEDLRAAVAGPAWEMELVTVIMPDTRISAACFAMDSSR